MLDVENKQLSRRTILVIDDVEMNRSIVKRVFKDTYNVFIAENGSDGMKVLHQHEVDLVLLDIVMPVLDGFGVLKAMKADPQLKAIPVIVITGEVERAEKQALDLGADDFIEQPYDAHIMRKRVENLIDRYELRKLREALHEQRRYRNLFDIMEIGYWEWTKSGGYYHSERYNDYAISEMANEDMWDAEKPFQYIHPDDVILMKQFMQKHSDDEIKKSAIVRCKMTDGSYKWTEMFSMAETAVDGQLVHLVSIMRDVDKEWLDQKAELEKALLEAEKANRAKTDFLSRVSHDMRTPLNGILGLTAFLKDTIMDKDALHDVSELEMSAHYLLELINDTLDINRIESGKLELHPVVCDGREMFNNTINLCKASLKGKDIKFNVDADDIPFTLLYVDVSRFQQAVLNVFGNAIKFTPEGGTIRLSLHNQSMKNGVITDTLVIQDTGIGMSKEFLPHIFESFAQENSTRTGQTQGTGLGMAITKQIANLMDGDVHIESEPGKGTTAYLTFKMKLATKEQIEEWKVNQTTIQRSVTLKGKRVLLCEDHPLNTQIATRLLQAKSMEVDHAQNGQVGVEMFKNSALEYYDVILMDIRMPVMDGIEATKIIRNFLRHDAKNIPILAMTANAFAEDIEQTRKAGMNAHLSKPIEPDVLYRTLSEQLNVVFQMKKEKILVVDDVEVNRTVIRASLEADYDILEAENGKQAIEIIQTRGGIDAVITDIQMPEMDGVELIRWIRSNKEYRHVVIIANTQFGDSEQEEKLLALGANDFVYKPTTPKIVEIRVRNAMKRI